MSTYVSLLRFTPKGIENIKDGPARLEAARKIFRDAGAEIKTFYLTLGEFDAVVVSEAPDDKTMAKLMLAIGSLGNVRTETLPAFTEDEYNSIVADLQ